MPSRAVSASMGELKATSLTQFGNQHGRSLFVFIPLRARALPCARGDACRDPAAIR
jgi:hypothetical protein